MNVPASGDIRVMSQMLETHSTWKQWLDECILFLDTHPTLTMDVSDKLRIVRQTWLFEFDTLNETLQDTVSCTDIGFVLQLLLTVCQSTLLRHAVPMEEVGKIRDTVRLAHVRHAAMANLTFAISENGVSEETSRKMASENMSTEQYHELQHVTRIHDHPNTAPLARQRL